jgi:hypothetical protein
LTLLTNHDVPAIFEPHPPNFFLEGYTMNEDLAKTIWDLERELLEPATRQSTQRLLELVADDFLEFGESGKRCRKSDLLRVLPETTPSVYVIEEFSIIPLAVDIVLATYRLRKGESDGDASHWSLRSSIWQRREHRWQIVFHQGTRSGEGGG